MLQENAAPLRNHLNLRETMIRGGTAHCWQISLETRRDPPFPTSHSYRLYPMYPNFLLGFLSLNLMNLMEEWIIQTTYCYAYLLSGTRVWQGELSHQLNKLRVSTPSIDTLHHRGRNNLPQPQTTSPNSQFTARKINPKCIT